jgi:tetratricopeptide (TPR) repeat protein
VLTFKKLFIYSILTFSVSSIAISQSGRSAKEYFNDAEYFISLGDYQEALYNYLEVYKSGYKNGNVNYRIGLCYVNIDGKKTMAIPYLEQAIQFVSRDYMEGSYKESHAPPEAFFYLGQAYQIDHQFKKAIDNYRRYLSLLPQGDMLGYRYTKQQIQACNRAKKIIADSVDYEIIKLGNSINNSASNYRPAVANNDSVIMYMNDLKFYDAIFYTTKRADGTWKNPKNVTQEIKSDGDFYPCHLSNDGNYAFLVMDDNFNSDIYFSIQQENSWAPFEEPEQRINTKYWESHASITEDRRSIYFSSNMSKDNQGGMDIYMIEKDLKGKWGRPINLGSTINTSFSEDIPFITADGKKLFFCSQGHNTLGGYDIFVAEKKGNAWGKPKNIGYPINTTDDDMFFCPTKNGKFGYYAKFEKNGKKNIYKVILEEDQ